MKISEKFELLKNTPSDINEHMEALRRYSAECESVVELGIGQGIGTLALAMGKPRKMTSYGLYISGEAMETMNQARLEGTDISIVGEDVLKARIDECDLLFIDTLHTEDQLRAEIRLHSEKVRKYIILHDTTTYGNVGELPGTGGLLPVIKETVGTGKWKIREQFGNNNGLMVLERVFGNGQEEVKLMKKAPKVLVAILHCEGGDWRKIADEGARKTWMTVEDENISGKFFYVGDSDRTHMDGDTLRVDEKEGLYNIGKKTLKAFEYALVNYDFDYLFRTNTSSYVNVHKLVEFLSGNLPEKYYGGVRYGYHYPDNSKKPVSFASGCGYVLSRDLVEKIVENREKWDHSLIDDVSIGKLLKDLEGIEAIGHPRLDIVDGMDLSTVTKKMVDKHFHFRCHGGRDRTHDVRAMNRIHDLLYKIT